MIRLDDILNVTDARRIVVELPITPRLGATVEIDMSDVAKLSDLSERYGDYIVESLQPDSSRTGLLLEVRPAAAKGAKT